MSALRRGRARRVREVHQFAPTECALCCIAMILSTYGSKNLITRLRRDHETGRDGLTIKQVATILRSYAMRVRTFRAGVEGLKRLALPALVYWNDSHLIVLEKITSTEVTVVDPSEGRRKYARAEFAARYSGLAMEAVPTSEYAPVRHRDPSVWWDFLRAMRNSRRPLIQAFVMSLLLYSFTLGMPVVIQHVINDFGTYFTKVSLPLVVLIFLGPMAAYFVISFLRSICLAAVIRSLGTAMMEKTFRTLLGLPYKYFANRSQGELLYRLSSIASVRDTISSQVSAVLLDLGSLIAVFTYIFYRSVPLGLTALGIFLLMTLVAVLSYHPIRRVTVREINETANSSSLQMEALSSIETLKVSGMTASFFEDWRKVYSGAMGQTRKRIIRQGAASSGHAMFQVFGPLLVLAAGMWLVQNGRLDLGSAVAVQAMTATGLGTVMTLAGAFTQLITANAQVSRVGDVLYQPPARSAFGGRQVALEGAVSLRDVGFSYPGCRIPALEGISFDVPAGSSVAIVGSTGSGKSTLGKLMMGLYPAQRGTVCFDGVPIDEISPESFSRCVSYVPQEISLSNRTISENITFGIDAAGPDAAAEAARQAQVHDDIHAMPLGYHTQVREMGGSLSGGQRQRIALARALAGWPRLLVLDEATSALDTVTESLIAASLESLDCTRVIIAHRLSTIRSADLVVVLEEGRVVQTGNHHSLVSVPGPYRDLVRSQVELSRPLKTREEV